MTISSNTYALASSTTSAYVTLSDADKFSQYVIVSNPTSYEVFVTSSATAPTVVMPTSATVPVKGQSVPSGSVMTYRKPIGDAYLGCISIAADAGKYIKFTLGSGE